MALLALSFALGCGSPPGEEGDSCDGDSDCAGGYVCSNERCARAQFEQAPPALPSQPQSTVQAQPPPVEVAAPPVPVPPALTLGRHRCSFTEAGSAYNRQCTVTALPDGSLRVVAPGTQLNPQNGFELTALGSAPAYRVDDGLLGSFDRCNGPIGGTLALDQSGAAPRYVIRWGAGCAIEIQL
jgi:hypothetical protein